MKEEWRDMPEYGGLYKVSNTGKIFSRKTGRLRKLTLNHDGYHRVALVYKGKRKSWMVHRLVMLLFVGPSDLTVNHKDSNRSNNHLSNLEYMTHSENILHGYRQGNITQKGEHNPKCKTKESTVVEVWKLLQEGLKPKEVSEITGVSRSIVYDINSGKSWTQITKITRSKNETKKS